MPHNVLEMHPYLDAIDYKSYDSNYFNSLIIGTFPIFSITSTLEPTGAVVAHPFDEKEAYMRFFYGSKRNSFWRLVSESLGEANPTEAPIAQRVSKSKELLTKHQFLITDVLFKTNRKATLAEDTNLWTATTDSFVNQNQSLNYRIQTLLEEQKEIKYLYFTATDLTGQSPFGWFQQIFKSTIQYRVMQTVGNRIISAAVTIGTRKYVAFFLPSPAGNGVRGLHFTDTSQTEIFANYMISVDEKFYNDLKRTPKANRTAYQTRRLTQLRKSYLVQHYKAVLVDKNPHFTGSI